MSVVTTNPNCNYGPRHPGDALYRGANKKAQPDVAPTSKKTRPKIGVIHCKSGEEMDRTRRIEAKRARLLAKTFETSKDGILA